MKLFIVFTTFLCFSLTLAKEADKTTTTTTSDEAATKSDNIKPKRDASLNIGGIYHGPSHKYLPPSSSSSSLGGYLSSIGFGGTSSSSGGVGGSGLASASGYDFANLDATALNHYRHAAPQHSFGASFHYTTPTKVDTYLLQSEHSTSANNGHKYTTAHAAAPAVSYISGQQQQHQHQIPHKLHATYVVPTHYHHQQQQPQHHYVQTPAHHHHHHLEHAGHNIAYIQKPTHVHHHGYNYATPVVEHHEHIDTVASPPSSHYQHQHHHETYEPHAHAHHHHHHDDHDHIVYETHSSGNHHYHQHRGFSSSGGGSGSGGGGVAIPTTATTAAGYSYATPAVPFPVVPHKPLITSYGLPLPTESEPPQPHSNADATPAYALGHKGLGHFTFTANKPHALNTDIIASGIGIGIGNELQQQHSSSDDIAQPPIADLSKAPFKPSVFLGAKHESSNTDVTNIDGYDTPAAQYLPPTSAGYEYQTPTAVLYGAPSHPSAAHHHAAETAAAASSPIYEPDSTYLPPSGVYGAPAQH